MPAPKKAAAKKAATKTASTRSFTVNVQMPGQPAVKKTLKAGTTVAELVSDMNLDGYVIRVNATEASTSKVLQKGDNIRVGIKTKQG